jgi:hypothetical protein
MADVCPYTNTQRDDDLWSILDGSSEDISCYKDWFTTFFNLKKDDWDEGWGWNQLEDHSRQFSKMYTAARTLGGVSGELRFWEPKLIPGYQGNDFIIPDNALYQWPSFPILVFDAANNSHVFIRTGAGKLFHYVYNPKLPIPHSTEVLENISDTCLKPSGQSACFSGNPFIFRGPQDGKMMVLGLPGAAPGDILLFEQTSEGATGNWSLTDLTPTGGTEMDSVRLSYPTVLKTAGDVFHIFGVNRNGEVFQYQWRSGIGVECIQALPKGSPNWFASDASGSLFAMAGLEGQIHVFAVDKPTGDLLYYRYSQGAWSAENVSELVDPRVRLSWYSELVATTDGEDIDVYGTALGGALLHFSYRPLKRLYVESSRIQASSSTGSSRFQASTSIMPAFHSFLKIAGWSAENVTEIAKMEPEPVGISEGIHIFPYIQVVSPSGIFGVAGSILACFSKTSAGWTQKLVKDATWGSCFLIGSILKAMVGPGASIQHVFGINPYSGGRVVHYSRLSPSTPMEQWCVELLPTPEGEQFLVDTTFAVADSPWGERHIVCLNKAKHSFVHFYETYSHAWHSSEDYSNWASGSNHHFRYVPRKEYQKGGIEHPAYAYAGWFRENRVEMWCPSFDADYGPEKRAAIMLHEATHIIYSNEIDVWNGDHDPKDKWYHHGLDAIPWGELSPHAEGHKHSMFQIEAEFLADIAEFPEDWIPLSIRSQARTTAEQWIDTKFSNTPGWTVGEPRPF